jgi:hypothetical protein
VAASSASQMDSVTCVHAWVEAADLEIVKRAKESEMVAKVELLWEWSGGMLGLNGG